MTTLNPHLHFEGNCRAAMTFYRDCFGGELTLLPVGQSPMASQMPAEMHDRILHALLQSAGLVLMASDMFGPGGVVRGDDVHLCLGFQSKAEIASAFTQLAACGQVGHPLTEEFFGTISDLTDRFGVRWMLQHTPAQPA